MFEGSAVMNPLARGRARCESRSGRARNEGSRSIESPSLYEGGGGDVRLIFSQGPEPMRRFRSNSGRVAWLAIFALACQFVLTFGHIHTGSVGGIFAALWVPAHG